MSKEYIEKEAVIEALGEEPLSWADTDTELQAMRDWEQFKAMVESISAADVKPVVYGEWKCVSRVYSNYGPWNKWYCSCCGYMRTAGWEHTSEGKRPNANLCENCGADMRPRENLKAGAEYADADTMMPAT